jgi:hypothetical protein
MRKAAKATLVVAVYELSRITTEAVIRYWRESHDE